MHTVKLLGTVRFDMHRGGEEADSSYNADMNRVVEEALSILNADRDTPAYGTIVKKDCERVATGYHYTITVEVWEQVP